MYPNNIRQRGSALVIAVFIIVVMLALVLALARLLTSSSQSVVYEVQGNRSLFAAQSGLELALVQLFPLDSSTTSCVAISTSLTFSGAGLQGCSASLSCTAFADASAGGSTLYRLSSTGSCSAGEYDTRRTVQIEVR